MSKFIFSNIVGTFIFNENYTLMDGLLFKDIEQYKNKKVYEDKLIKKYKKVSKLNEKNIYNILLFFKNKKYFSEFYKKNLEITKNSIKNSVSNDLLIINTISNIEELNKIINSLTKNVRDWYSLYAPEISNKIKDNEVYRELALLFKNGVEKIDPAELSGAIKGRNNLYHHLESMLKNAKKSIILPLPSSPNCIPTIARVFAMIFVNRMRYLKVLQYLLYRNI